MLEPEQEEWITQRVNEAWMLEPEQEEWITQRVNEAWIPEPEQGPATLLDSQVNLGMTGSEYPFFLLDHLLRCDQRFSIVSGNENQETEPFGGVK